MRHIDPDFAVYSMQAQAYMHASGGASMTFFPLDLDPQETAFRREEMLIVEDLGRSPIGHDRLDLRAVQMRAATTFPSAVDAALARMTWDREGPELFGNREQRRIGD